MTDKEKLIKLFTEFGIGFQVNPTPYPFNPTAFKSDDFDFVVCFQGANNIDGYAGFYATFEFTKAGNFIKMEVWE